MATIVPATIKFSEFAEQTAAQDDIFVGLKSGANAQFTYAAAPSDATYILQTADADLTNAQAIGDLANGFLVGTTTTGVILSRTLTGTSNEIDVANGDGISSNPTVGISDNPVIPGTAGMSIPAGTTGERIVPSSPNINLRWNTTINAVEYYDHGSTAWEQLAESLPDGPDTSVQYNNGGAFAGSANFTFDGTDVQILGNFRTGTATTQIPFTGILPASAVIEGGNNLTPLIVKTNATASGYAMLVHNSVPSALNDTVRIQGVGASNTTALLNCLNNANDTTGTATSIFYVRADGKVGIGTNAPDTTLHIVGDEQIIGNLRAGTATTQKPFTNVLDANVVFEGGNALAPLIVKTNSTASGYGMLVHSSVPSQINDTARIQSVGASSTAAILNCLNNANDVTGSATSVFYVRADGNVGVGTDSPSSTLHVVGDAQVDNININGNTITSTDAAGNINLTPDTTGDLVLDGLKWPQSDGSAGQTLITDGAAQLSWSDAGSVTVPTVDQTVARFNGTTGALEDSGVTINDSDVMSGVTQLNVDNLRADGNTIDSTSGALNLTGATDVNITSTSGDINLTAGSGNIVAADNFIAGDPGTESSGIDINGTTYDSVFKASDIGGSNAALGIYHRHSTTLQPLLIGAHSNSDTSAHGTVTSGQSMFTVYGAGWTGSHYDLFGAIDISADTSGTISTTSSPGRIRFQVTPDASNIPATALSIANDKTATFSGQIAMSTNKITGMGDPTSDQDAATKKYVDDQIADLIFLQPVRVATTANFTSTYNNGTSGVGATLTATSNGAASIDSTSLLLNDRVLFKNQTTTYENGIYYVSQVGDGSNPAIYTRATDFDEADEINPGDLVTVTDGATLQYTAWLQTATVTTIGTDAITFVQFSASLSGLVTIAGAQTITGAKTFSSDITMSSADIDLNGNSVDGGDLGANTAITSAQIDNININGNTISTTDTNGNLILDTDGVGSIVVDKADHNSSNVLNLDVALCSSTTFIKLDSANIASGSNWINCVGNNASSGFLVRGDGAVAVGTNTVSTGAKLTVDGAIHTDNLSLSGNTISTTDTDGDLVFDPDGTGFAIFNNSSTVFGLNNTSGYTALYLGSSNTGTVRNGALLANYDSPYEVRLRASNATNNAPLYFDGSSSTVYGSFQTSGDLWLNSGLSFNSGTDVMDAYLNKNEYTPTVTCGSGSITLNTSSDTLGYTRVGSLVYVQGQLSVSSVSTPSGTLTLSLPITAASMGENSEYMTGSCVIANAASNANEYCVQIFAASSTTVSILRASTTALANPAADFSGNEIIRVGFSYLV